MHNTHYLKDMNIFYRIVANKRTHSCHSPGLGQIWPKPYSPLVMIYFWAVPRMITNDKIFGHVIINNFIVHFGMVTSSSIMSIFFILYTQKYTNIRCKIWTKLTTKKIPRYTLQSKLWDCQQITCKVEIIQISTELLLYKCF